MSTGNLIPPLLTDYQKALDWVSGGVILVILSIILALSLNTILRGLNENITKVRMLATDADREREQLRLRSQDLQRRLAQLRAAAEIEHTISAVLETKELMQKVVDLLSERFGLYHVGVFLLGETASSLSKMDGEGKYDNAAGVGDLAQAGAEVILRAGTGNIVPKGYTLILSGTTNAWWAMVNRKPRMIETTGKKDPYTATYLPLAHTELALPLISQERVTGILMIHSTQSNAFEEDDISLFQSAADSLAIALENAALFKQNQDDLEEIRALQKQYLSRSWAETQQVHGNLSYTYEASPDQGAQTTAPGSSFSAFNTPISVRNLTIGHFELESDKNAWSVEDRTFIESVITEAALALENTRLLDETQRRANHDRLVAEVTRAVQSSTDIEGMLSSAIRELGRKLQASEAIIRLNTVAEKDDQEVTS
jgi:GAF domain-containing protein